MIIIIHKNLKENKTVKIKIKNNKRSFKGWVRWPELLYGQLFLLQLKGRLSLSPGQVIIKLSIQHLIIHYLRMVNYNSRRLLIGFNIGSMLQILYQVLQILLIIKHGKLILAILHYSLGWLILHKIMNPINFTVS